MKFTELDLKPDILKALDSMKFHDLTPIQEATFPHVLAGKDLLARAETGSGKTSACAIPLMQTIDEEKNAVQALILVPTRELALQYVGEIALIAKFSPVEPFAVYGGADIDIQKAKINHHLHVLVATPGRLIDLLRNSNLSLRHIRTVVLDEADEMLKMGFIDDVEFIMSCIIQEHQTLFFSATMPPAVNHLVERYLKDPASIALNTEDIAPSSLQHTFQYIGQGHRLAKLEEYLREQDIRQAIIFSNSRHGGDKLLGRLRKNFDSVDYIHGGIDQSRRTSIFNRFKRKEIKLMVATDIARRGLDFTHVSHVINFDFPQSHEIYTHRTGRTGRMGRLGTALTLVTDRDLGQLKDMLRVNRIDAPQWLGHEPDLKKAGKRHQRHRGGGRGQSRRRPSGQRQRR
jgi:ATP-dependent RNA helicase DeaD